MTKISRRKQAINAVVEPRVYSVMEAVELLTKTATAKFVESAEVHIDLNIDPKYSDQQLRATLILPNGTGKTKRVAVLMPEEQIQEEHKNLADVIGSDDLIATMEKGELNFDILLATPDMMPKLAKLGRVLGPRGLMPSPKAGTVTTDVLTSIQEFKGGKVEYRADKTGVVHVMFGKTNFSIEQLYQNLQSVYQSIEQNKPSGAKGRYFNNMVICSTMGPAIKVDWLTFNS